MALPGLPSLLVWHGPHAFLSAPVAVAAVASLELLSITKHGYYIQRASPLVCASTAAAAVVLLTFQAHMSSLYSKFSLRRYDFLPSFESSLPLLLQ